MAARTSRSLIVGRLSRASLANVRRVADHFGIQYDRDTIVKADLVDLVVKFIFDNPWLPGGSGASSLHVADNILRQWKGVRR